MADNIRKVFISSTSKDLTEHREQARDACLQLDMFPKMMEYLPASAANAVEISLQMVDDSDLYLGIFAHRYGDVPAGHDIAVTEMEYRRAVDKGMPRLIFVMHAEHLIKAENVEQGEATVKMAALKENILANNIVNFFKSPADLRAQVIASLSHYRQAPSQQSAQQAGITIEQTVQGSSGGTMVGYVQGNVYIHRGGPAPAQPGSAPSAAEQPAASKQIFVAFASADGGSYARRAKAALTAAGYVAQAEDDFFLNRQQAVQQAINSAAALVVVMTRGALASREVSGQWDYALDERRIPVIVLLTSGFDPGDLPLSLRTLGSLDGRVDYDAALARLVREIGRLP